MTIPPAKPAYKPLPTPLLHYVECTQMVGFTWKQRLMILVGFKVLLHAFLHSQHAPGRFKPTFRVMLTPHDKLAIGFSDEKNQTLVAQGEPWPVDLVRATAEKGESQDN